MTKKIEKLIVVVVLAAGLLNSGCGMVGIVGSEGAYEKKVPAEYDLTKQKGGKILVLVEQPGWADTKTNLRYYLTRAIHQSLVAKVKVKPPYIITYKQLADFRSDSSDFSSLSPVEVGKALGADTVLLVTVENCQLAEMHGTDYYNGLLSVQASLFQTATGEKVWPESEGNRSIKVSFETGERGAEGAVNRLVSACAYCVTRYFYNCPRYIFKTFDERGDSGWEDWNQ
ncbi:MAG: hypothetical protein PHY02_07480 [Phycisphaerae bacterium]|nr:hypothetical protein [Phycisphaerae bacterium]